MDRGLVARIESGSEGYLKDYVTKLTTLGLNTQNKLEYVLCIRIFT